MFVLIIGYLSSEGSATISEELDSREHLFEVSKEHFKELLEISFTSSKMVFEK